MPSLNWIFKYEVSSKQWFLSFWEILSPLRIWWPLHRLSQKNTQIHICTKHCIKFRVCKLKVKIRKEAGPSWGFVAIVRALISTLSQMRSCWRVLNFHFNRGSLATWKRIDLKWARADGGHSSHPAETGWQFEPGSSSGGVRSGQILI